MLKSAKWEFPITQQLRGMDEESLDFWLGLRD